MTSLHPAEEFIPGAMRILAAVRARLAPLLPPHELTLTGGSSVPGALTKGDVDLHLRVSPGDFAATVGILRTLYEVEHPDVHVRGLCEFRARVAMAVPDADTVRMGKGWNDDTPRQSLPDWHLDKLAGFAGRFRVVSALENTHCPNYFTEKLFDAFAVGSIPVYAASASHGLDRLVDPSGYITMVGSFDKSASFGDGDDHTSNGESDP